jgi:hypothetical protein
MFAETLLWLRDRLARHVPKDGIWNSILEDYLIHARILIHFVCKSQARDNDVIAVDYFHDLPKIYVPLDDALLDEWADKIGGNLVHITTKPMPALKSQQAWPIDEIAARLVPALETFLNNVPDSRLVDGARTDCMNHLAKLSPPIFPGSANAST